MNTHRRISRFPVALAATLLVVVSLLGSLAPTVSAQTTPGAVLATQFFGSITGEGTGYQLSPDAILHTPEGEYVGQAGLAEFGDVLEASFSDLTFTTESAVRSGNTLIVAFTLTGINIGSYYGVAANCAGIAVPGVAFLRVSEERTTTTHWNEQTMSQDYKGAQVATVRTVVIEQWIDYNADGIRSQISAVNLMDPGDRPGCSAEVVTADQDEPADLPPFPDTPNRGDPY